MDCEVALAGDRDSEPPDFRSIAESETFESLSGSVACFVAIIVLVYSAFLYYVSFTSIYNTGVHVHCSSHSSRLGP